MFLCDLPQMFKIQNVHSGIGGGFRKNHFGFGFDQFFNLFRFVYVEIAVRNIPFWQILRQQTMRGSKNRSCRNNMISTV